MIRVRPSSVRVHTTLAATLALGLALGIGASAVAYGQRITLTNSIESEARVRATTIASDIDKSSLSDDLIIEPGDNSIIQIVDPNGAVAAQSSNAVGRPTTSNLRPSVGGEASQKVERLPGGGNVDFYVAARRVATSHGDQIIYVASSLEPVTKSTIVLIELFFAVVPILIVIVGVTTWFVTGRALRPVTEIRRQVDAIESGDLNRRVTEPKTNDEIRQLAVTMNAMLERLQRSAERQKRFVADASHELRSPLTAIRARLEVDTAYPEKTDWQISGRDVLDDTIRLQRLIEDLLALARLDDQNLVVCNHTLVDLDEIVLSETRRLRARTTRNVATSEVSGAQIRGNADELTRAVRNLLDNAGRHAKSNVTVRLAETTESVKLVVSDDGPGVPEPDRERVFERFTRLDDERTRDVGGSGLGLAITREVVLAHHGAITIDGNPGAEFSVTFPLP